MELSIFNYMVKYSEDLLSHTFAALSDPTRRAILTRLTGGAVQVTELAMPFGMSLPAISKHLKVLEQANLITRHRDGRIHRFSLNQEPIDAAKSWIESYQQFWQQNLQALDTYLQNTVTKEKRHGTRRTNRK